MCVALATWLDANDYHSHLGTVRHMSDTFGHARAECESLSFRFAFVFAPLYHTTPLPVNTYIHLLLISFSYETIGGYDGNQLGDSHMLICVYMNMLIFAYANIRICEYSYMLIFAYANMHIPLYKGISAPVCQRVIYLNILRAHMLT